MLDRLGRWDFVGELGAVLDDDKDVVGFKGEGASGEWGFVVEIRWVVGDGGFVAVAAVDMVAIVKGVDGFTGVTGIGIGVGVVEEGEETGIVKEEVLPRGTVGTVKVVVTSATLWT